jgi:hypothetical protein
LGEEISIATRLAVNIVVVNEAAIPHIIPYQSKGTSFLIKLVAKTVPINDNY